jgi:hypothetical protein
MSLLGEKAGKKTARKKVKKVGIANCKLHTAKQPQSARQPSPPKLIMCKFCKLKLIIFSDGAGRSGVYLAIDSNIELSEEDGVFDVHGYLKKMRQQRRGLVESLVSLVMQFGAKTSTQSIYESMNMLYPHAIDVILLHVRCFWHLRYCYFPVFYCFPLFSFPSSLSLFHLPPWFAALDVFLGTEPIPFRLRDAGGVHPRYRLALPGQLSGREDKGAGNQGQEDQEERLPDGVYGEENERRNRSKEGGSEYHK